MNLTRNRIILAAFFVVFLFFAHAHVAKAANCGGAVACSCGDTITSNYTLDANLNCAAINTNGSSALVVGANNVIIDGNGYEIKNTPQTPNVGDITWGIYNRGFTGVQVKNLKITNMIIGVYFDNNASGVIQNNVIYNGLGNLDRYNGLTTPTLSYEKTIYS